MALYPDVQSKAQAELDAVVGTGRLPEFEDRQSLPYTSALVKELLRWHVVGPIGLPHRVVDNDVYNGYLIPAGATIVANIRAITRDPATYPDPDNFVPERFLNGNDQLTIDDKDSLDFVFGFGRRKCPGKPFAESSLWIMCASVLAVFKIGPPIDINGTPTQLRQERTTHNVISCVTVFYTMSRALAGSCRHVPVHEYSMTPRSEQARRLLEEL